MRPDEKLPPSKDDIDLIAAALGLRSSAWAKAVLHITPAEPNFMILTSDPDDDENNPDDDDLQRQEQICDGYL